MALSNGISGFGLKIGIIGAGFSGICAGIKLQKELNIYNYTIFDQNHEVGGTWLTHTYPGCACDIVSHMYSFSFELNPDWSQAYATQPEILAYLKRVATKYDLYSRIKFNHEAKQIAWDDTINKWRIVVHDKIENKTTEYLFDILIGGVGAFRNASVPKELETFEGPTIHSSQWDSSIELEDKVVAVVGSGCSAVQIVPAIMPKVKKLLSFQRHPAWVLPQDAVKFPEIVKTLFSIFPFLLWLYRVYCFFCNEIKFSAFSAKSLLRRLGQWDSGRHLKKQIPNDREKRKKLKPNYEMGCKRISPSNTFYKALASSNAEVITSTIKSAKKNVILTADGNEYKIDVLVLATGYKVQDYFFPMKVFARNSEDIMISWKENGPSHYLGICSNSVPNAFLLLGPNTASGHNSVIFAIECQMNWTIQVLREMLQRHVKVYKVKKSAEDKYMQDIQEMTKQMVWGTFKCGSWYEDHRGVNTTLYPASLINYWKKTRKPEFSDLEFN